MPLTGINAMCIKCKNDCKQWEQVDIRKCPNFREKARGLILSDEARVTSYNTIKSNLVDSRAIEWDRRLYTRR